MRVPAKARVIDKTRRMNRLESKFYSEYLTPLQLAGEITYAKFEGISLSLGSEGGPRLAYKPDFFTVYKDGSIHCWETKGSWEAKNARDGRTRVKLAASLFWMFHFHGVTLDKSRKTFLFEDFSL